MFTDLQKASSGASTAQGFLKDLEEILQLSFCNAGELSH